MELAEAKNSNDYNTAQELLNFIKSYQIKILPEELLMNMSEIKDEISYNKSDLLLK